MISDKTYKLIMKSCNFRSNKTSDKCDNAMNYAMNHEFGNIDQYSIYTPSCDASKTNTTTKISPSLKKSLIGRRFSGYDPCTESYAEKYYNRVDVRKALHANVTGIPYKWTACRWACNIVSYMTLILLQVFVILMFQKYYKNLQKYHISYVRSYKFLWIFWLNFNLYPLCY